MLALGDRFCIHIKGGKFYQHHHAGMVIDPQDSIETVIALAEHQRRQEAAEDVADARVRLDEQLARQREIEEALS